jgi:arsenate reductase (glutaredoxin)
MSVTIYHNPACGTSRNTLAMIRQSGEEPEVIEYLKDPPSRERLIELIGAMGISVRALLREKGYALCGTGACRRKMERRPVARFHAGASDPDQPADRRDRERHAALPAVGSRS